MAAGVLNAGGVVAYPTEAVWGLGVDPFNTHAVQRLLAVKRRSFDKGVLLVGADIAMAEPWLSGLPAEVTANIASSWPGPTTWVLPNQGVFPKVVTGGRDTIAIRISAHPLVQALSSQFGGLVVSTSANLSGVPACRSKVKVMKQLGDKVDYVLSGALGGRSSPSAIYDALSGCQLR